MTMNFAWNSIFLQISKFNWIGIYSFCSFDTFEANFYHSANLHKFLTETSRYLIILFFPIWPWGHISSKIVPCMTLVPFSLFEYHFSMYNFNGIAYNTQLWNAALYASWWCTTGWRTPLKIQYLLCAFGSSNRNL